MISDAVSSCDSHVPCLSVHVFACNQTAKVLLTFIHEAYVSSLLTLEK